MMTLRLERICVFALAVTVAMAEPSPSGAGSGENANVAPPDADHPPTAEDVLKALQRRRPANDVIPSASLLARGGEPAAPTLLPDGFAVVSRTGRVEKSGDWWTFVFDSGDEEPRKLLPDAKLEQMVRMVTGGASPITFSLSGELTVFDGENYLLPREALRSVASRDPEQAANERGKAGMGETEALPKVSVAADASAEDVLAALRNQEPERSVIPAAPDSVGEGSEQLEEASQAPLFDGSPLVSRPGRLIRQGAWWMFVSESDHPDNPELPLRLLPNLGVETMVRMSQRSASSPVFVVSGEVTSFFGNNYLLPRAVRRRIDTGNLRP